MEQERRERMFRFYVTDVIKVISESLAGVFGGACVSKRYADILQPTAKDTRTGEEIANDVLSQICFSGGENK